MGWLRRLVAEAPVRFGEAASVEIQERTALIHGPAGSLALTCPLEGVLRVRTGRGGVFGEDRSFAVTADRSGRAEPHLDEGPGKFEIGIGGMTVVVRRQPATFSFFGRDGKPLLTDHPAFGFAWKDEGASVGARIEDNARYYGFGEKTGPLDKRGRALDMWNTDMPYTVNHDPIYTSIPLALVAREGRTHGLFFDNPAKARFSVGADRPDLFGYETRAGEIELYLIEGPTPREVVERFTALTGRMELPPRWSLGHHQSRWSYVNEGEVREIAKNFRDRDLPGDVIHLDIDYMRRYRVFTWHSKRFPDPAGMIRDLAEQGFKVVTIIDPGVAVAEDYPVYREGRERGLYCRDEKGGEYRSRVWPGEVAFPDFTNPETRQWWAGLHQVLTDQGVAGVWNDMNEPSSWAVDLRPGKYMIPLKPVRHPKMMHNDEGRLTPHLQLRNVYGLLECEATREGLKKLRPGERPFVLTRSGYAGIQRHAALWTGDNSSSFAHLANSIPMLLNLGLSGVAFIGSDIGGFKFSCTGELYARWIQLGAFHPLCRTHSALLTHRQEPWSFGPRVEAVAREFLKLRQRLHPTMYSLIREAHDTGAPVLRPLFFEFPGDHGSYETEDELMFGPSLLLAPVVQKGATRREVYLPPGGWYDWWSGERIEGPKVVTRETPLELMPIYARAGAILFMQPSVPSLSGPPPDRLFIEVFPNFPSAVDETSSFELYEDDGVSDAYEKGEFRRRRVSQTRTGEELLVTVHPREGSFTPPPRKLVLRVHIGGRSRSVSLDGASISIDRPTSFNLTTGVISLDLDDDGEGHELRVRL